MIILISSTDIDPTTDLVIGWIMKMKKNATVLRINSDNDYHISFELNDAFIFFKGEKIALSNIDSFWYRRGRIKYKFNQEETFNELRNEESKALEEFIHYKMKTKRYISDFFNSEVNKLIVLERAKECGLLVPETYILENKTDVCKLLSSKKIITKNFLPSSGYQIGDETALIYTNDVSSVDLSEDQFVPSLFQEKIEKKIELRIFYFREIFWSMAIFSQNDETTSTDFRIYNNSNPNKNVSFSLPKKIKTKLINLMNLLKLDSGSIDMILTLDNKYIFLEVNPIGQFGMVSYPCNYHIEKEIAKFLSYED